MPPLRWLVPWTVAVAVGGPLGSSRLQTPDAVRAELARQTATGPAVLGAELEALYGSGAPAPLWVDESGHPTAHARDALALLADASADGLDPVEYGVPALQRAAAHLAHAAPCDVARFDVGLSAGMLRYLRHLHHGRIDPRTIGFRLRVPADDHDLAALLRAALAEGRISHTAAVLMPPLAQYHALRRALPSYRALAADARLEDPLRLPRTLRPGDRGVGLGALHRRLQALGDAPAGAPAPADDDPYDGAIVDAVMRFQRRHGLDADGVIGRATENALRVPLAWRVRQIELALERLRWLPHPSETRALTLNIPMFRLWAWDGNAAAGPPALTMAVIVGRAMSTETPVFVEDLREVIFRPYWNVPSSILRGELLPIIARDPGYLARENMEIVRGGGDAARAVAPTPANVALLRLGVLRLRQRPGPRNALGLVKFVFPNAENVYMHGTPAQALFSRSRRDFSHGCVRVEDPAALAEWVLRDQPGWTRNRIAAAMTAPTSERVPLANPIRVVLFYTTAAIVPDLDELHFAEDIYGHDTRLDAALTAAARTGETW